MFEGAVVAVKPIRKPKRVRVALVCNECEKTYRVSPNAADPRCPNCGSVDYEVK